MTEPPTENLTFLFTDIVGSTRLWEQFPQQMQQAHTRHGQLIAACVEQQQGRLVLDRGEGDSTFSVFANALDAVIACCAFQRALQAEAWPTNAPIAVRAALHTGYAHQHADDYNSTDVNRCARLRAVGHGGQTLVSERVCRAVQAHLPPDMSLRDMGRHRLKDLRDPEHIFQICHAELRADFPPLQSLDNWPNNLPRQISSFIGRAAEMRAARGLLQSHPLVTLIGTGGAGKTRLALQVGAELLTRYAGGVWLVELAALSDGALVPQTVAAALGLREEPGRRLMDTLLDYLRPRNLLLILDNCEHLVHACAVLSDELLRHCPNLSILSTSRELLMITGEEALRVQALALPESADPPPGEKDTAAIFIEYDAVRLFVERARQCLPSFTLDRRSAPVVARIVRQLDGIPLAIELAAARLRVMSVEQLEARLNDRFRLLAAGSRVALPRQQSLRALIDWSYELLNDREKTLLRRLSVFAGGWTLDAAEAVCAGEGMDALDILDALDGLTSKSLLQCVERADVEGEREAGVRYQMLETIRHYARERLIESHEAESIGERHQRFYTAWAEKAEPCLRGMKQAAWLGRVEEEHGNLRDALNWRRGTAALRLAGALWRFWEVRGYFQEGRGHLESALSGFADPDCEAEHKAARAKALFALGVLACCQSSFAAAGDAQEKSLQLWRELEDQKGAAASLNNLGLIAERQGDYKLSRALHQQSLALYRERGEAADIAALLGNLAIVEQHLNNYTAARALQEESLALRRALEDTWGIASSLNHLGNLACDQDDYRSAQRFHQESMELMQELGDRRGIAAALNNLGNLARNQGDYNTSIACYQQGLLLMQELGDQRSAAYIINNLGLVAQYQGDYAKACGLFEKSLALRRQIGDKWGVMDALNNLGNTAYAQQDYAKARSLLEASLSACRDLGDVQSLANTLGNLGCVVYTQGNYAAAHELFAESLRMRHELGNQGGVAVLLECFAALAVTRSDASSAEPLRAATHAARLRAAANAARQAANTPLHPSERAENEQALAGLLETLGRAAFEAAWRAGGEMSLAAAVEQALLFGE